MSTSPFSPGLLKGSRALVTGGGTGICRGIALALARAGADVAIASRKQEHLDPTLAELRALGVASVAVAGDVRIAAEVDAIVGLQSNPWPDSRFSSTGPPATSLRWRKTCRRMDLAPWSTST